MEKLYEELESNGIEVIDDTPVEVDDTVAAPDDGADDYEDGLTADGITIDDPVKVYLKGDRPRAAADPRGRNRAGAEDSGGMAPMVRRPSSV